MRSILVLGAGRSSSSLIQYLLQNASENDWQVFVGDLSESAALERIQGVSAGKFVPFDINNATQSRRTISQADLVISLLPANLHPKVAEICLEFGRHLLTACYVSDEMAGYHQKA